MAGRGRRAPLAAHRALQVSGLQPWRTLEEQSLQERTEGVGRFVSADADYVRHPPPPSLNLERGFTFLSSWVNM